MDQVQGLLASDGPKWNVEATEEGRCDALNKSTRYNLLEFTSRVELEETVCGFFLFRLPTEC